MSPQAEGYHLDRGGRHGGGGMIVRPMEYEEGKDDYLVGEEYETYPQIHEPLPLRPLTAIPIAQRVQRRVRCRAGSAPRTRLVLQPVSSSSRPNTISYAFSQLIKEDPEKGVTIFMATPKITQVGSSPHLVTCGSHVVVKATRQPYRSVITVDNPISEVAAMQRLQQFPEHPNVISLMDCLQDEEFVYLVLPYISGGDLFARVDGAGGVGLEEAEAAYYFKQMAEGLRHMKTTCGLAHHDISLENVMLSPTSTGPVAKIIDLGMCMMSPKIPSPGEFIYLTPMSGCGKASYVAPEVVREEACDPFASDVWSLAVCLYIMLTGRPFYASPHDQSFKVMEKAGGIKQILDIYENYGLHISRNARDLIIRMLHHNPDQRYTLEEVLQHPFVCEAEPFLPPSRAAAASSGSSGSSSATSGGGSTTSSASSSSSSRSSSSHSDSGRSSHCSSPTTHACFCDGCSSKPEATTTTTTTPHIDIPTSQ